VSLANADALFANAAGLVVAELASDELPQVRQGALQALLAWASAFHAAKQQQQQQASLSASQDAAAGGDAEMQEQPEDEEEDAQEDGEAPVTPPPAADAEQLPGAGSTELGSQEQQQQEQQQRRSSGGKARKSDLPLWGKEAIAAAERALTDCDAAARRLALDLLPLLPPANVPSLVGVLRALAACCVRFPGQHDAQVASVAAQLAQRRAEMVTLGVGKLVPELGRVLAAGGGGGGQTTGSSDAPPAAAGGCQADSSPSALPTAAQVLTRVMLVGVQRRHQGLAALLRELGKAGLLHAPLLQPWMQQLRALEGPEQQQREET
jgi:hypothetical protein